MRYFITTDTHFGHTAIKEYCGRPDNFEQLIWNGFKSLKPSHMLIHLGDICWNNADKVHDKLAEFCCTKVLVKGNHDSKSDNWYMNNGWDFVCETFSIERHSKKIIFSHEPRAWDGYFDINICGHLHNSQHHLENELKGIQRHGQYVLALENNNYQLFDLDKILKDVG